MRCSKFGNWQKYSALLLIITANILFRAGMLTECIILSNQLSQNFQRHPDELVLMNNNVTILSDVKSILSCASYCVSYAQCRGFTYSANQHQCQIKDTLSNCTAGASDLKSLESDAVYYHHLDKTCETNGSYIFISMVNNVMNLNRYF